MGQGQARYFDITATMGPACSEIEIINDLIRAGVTSFRFPFAKETPKWQLQQAKKVRKAANTLEAKVALIMDIPGFQPRTLNDHPIQFQDGQKIAFALQSEVSRLSEDICRVQVSEPEKLVSVREGDVIIVGDGELAFKVEYITSTHILGYALLSGALLQKRGLTIENRESICETLSERDKEILTLNARYQFDRVMVSFVKSRIDIDEVRKFLKKVIVDGRSLPQIAIKVETREAVTNITEVVEAADYILIGRGDLALQTGIVDFYSAQETVIAVAHQVGKPVQVGTQLLESSAENWIPYRAELSDVSNLIARGINGILLSAETTISKNPVRSVEIIQQLLKHYQRGL